MDFLWQTLASSALSAALLGFGAWLLRTYIQTRLKATVEHEFNVKLSSIQSQLRQTEEMYKDRLRESAAEIQTLQSGSAD
ncbi:gp58-like family protein [Rugamonas sp. A1-17]|nr:gp58-like family protein [Rugamonas sp. A1-17]